jgi:hypothetical protein
VNCRYGATDCGVYRVSRSVAPDMTCKKHRLARCIARAEVKDVGSSDENEVRDVVALRGIRVSLEKEDPVVEYRVHWKGDSPDTW